MHDAKPLPPRAIGFSMMFSTVICALIQCVLKEAWDWWLFFILLAFGAALSGAAMVLVTLINNVALHHPGNRYLPPE